MTKSKRRKFILGVEEITEDLRNMGSNMIKLSEELADSGERPTKWQRNLIRTAVAERITMLFDEAKYFFLTGNAEDLEGNLHICIDIAKQID